MSSTVLSFFLAAGSIGGLWIISKNAPLGWLWTLIMEFLWVFYSFLTKQWGLLVLCLCYGIVYSYNLYKSRKVVVVKKCNYCKYCPYCSPVGVEK